MKRSSLAALIALSLSMIALPGPPGARGAPESAAARISPENVLGKAAGGHAKAVDQLFAEWTDADSPGAAVGVVQQGRLVLSRAYGLANLEYRIPVTPATSFDIGSMTKQFTAFAVAMLVEQGKLSPEDDVRKYIPEMRARRGVIRIKHLLGHTSGLKDEFNLLTMEGFGVDDAITYEHSLRLITNQEELLFEPGQRWEYCNSGYTLLAEIISRVTGKSYTAWMKDNVFNPLGMARTGFPDAPGTIISGRAYSYTGGPGHWRTAVVNKLSLGPSNLFSTVEDLAKWAANLADGRVGGRGVADRMAQPWVLNQGTTTDYAYGQFVGQWWGLRTLSHDGGIGGFRSVLIRFPDQDLAVVVLANADHFRATTLARAVAEVFIGHLLQAPTSAAKPAASSEGGDSTPVELEDCVGSYRLESTGKVLEVTLQGTLLSLGNLATGGKTLPLSRLQGNQFMVGGAGLKVSFVKNQSGQVDRLILHVGNPPERASRIAVVRMTPDELARFAGAYMSRELLTVYVLDVRNGALVASHSRWPPANLIPTGSAEFSSERAWLKVIRFELDSGGRPLGFRADAAYAKNVYFERLK